MKKGKQRRTSTKSIREKEGESGASLVFCCAIMLQRVARGVMAAV
jgi:hypothetical protein